MLDLDPKVHVVYAYHPGLDDFAVWGLYSKEEDAETLMQGLRQEPETMNAVTSQQLRMSTVIALLAKGRLLAIATVLDNHLTDMEIRIAALTGGPHTTIPETDHTQHAFHKEAVVHSCNPGGDPVYMVDGQDGGRSMVEPSD